MLRIRASHPAAVQAFEDRDLRFDRSVGAPIIVVE